MLLLTVNAGSSSLRLNAFEIAEGGIRPLREFHGEREGSVQDPLRSTLGAWSLGRIGGVAHRVVHGGPRLTRSCVVTEAVEREIERLAKVAPLHNPAALEGIRACREILGPETPQVAVFDTAFYASLPEESAAYAIPRDLAAKHDLRRYGFHGLAHRAMETRWRTRTSANGTRVISFQLGSGCSATAIRDGAPVETSMGFSPLEGLVMATRSGDFDPGLLLYLQREEGLGPDALERLLEKECGLKGISGRSGDMRELLQAEDEASRLAIAVYVHRARKYLGAYLAVLGGADAVLFGGGVGENAPSIRAMIVDGMEWAGLVLDRGKNEAARGSESRIDAASSRTEVWVIPVDEARILAEEARAVLSRPQT